MELTKTIFQNSAIFIEKKWVENRLWGEGAFLWGKTNASFGAHCLSAVALGPAKSEETGKPGKAWVKLGKPANTRFCPVR